MLSGCKVGALHGIKTVNGVSHSGLKGADLRPCHEAVAEAGEGRVAVDVVENGVVSCKETKQIKYGLEKVRSGSCSLIVKCEGPYERKITFVALI